MSISYPNHGSRPTPTKRLMFNKGTRKWEYKVVDSKNYYDKGIKLNKPGNRGMWKVKSAKVKGAFGDEDANTKTIRINKKLSSQARKHKGSDTKKYGMSRKDTSVINSLDHEIDHAKHPKMRENNIRKLAHKQVARQSKKQKGKLYRLISKKRKKK